MQSCRQCHVLLATFRCRALHLGSHGPGTSTVSSPHQTSFYLHCIMMDRNPPNSLLLSTFTVNETTDLALSRLCFNPGNPQPVSPLSLWQHSFIILKACACTSPCLHACLGERVCVRTRTHTHRIHWPLGNKRAQTYWIFLEEMKIERKMISFYFLVNL